MTILELVAHWEKSLQGVSVRKELENEAVVGKFYFNGVWVQYWKARNFTTITDSFDSEFLIELPGRQII